MNGVVIPVFLACTLGLVALVKATKYIKVGRRSPISSQTPYERKLGLLEKWYACFEPPRMFTESLIVKGTPPSYEHVIEIIKVLCERFTLLSAAMDYSGEPKYVKLDMPSVKPFPVQIQEVPTGEWEAFVAQQLNTHFTPRTPLSHLWRLIVLHDVNNPLQFAVVVTFHHIIADGMSGVAFLKHFMSIHNELMKGEKPSVSPIEAPQMEDVVDVRPALYDLLSEIFSAFVKKKARVAYLGPMVTSPKLTTSVFVTKLNEGVLRPLREACKANKVTMHGALSAALMFASAKAIYHDNFAPEGGSFHLSYNYPVALRKFVKAITPNFMNLMVCAPVLKDVAIRHNTLFWDEARNVNATQQKGTEKAVALIGMLNFVPEKLEDFVNKTRLKGLFNSRVETLELSNLGQVDFSVENNGDWTAEELSFLIPNHLAGPVFMNACATVGNTMNMVLTIPAPAISEETGQAFRTAFSYAIQLAIKNPQFMYGQLYGKY